MVTSLWPNNKSVLFYFHHDQSRQENARYNSGQKTQRYRENMLRHFLSKASSIWTWRTATCLSIMLQTSNRNISADSVHARCRFEVCITAMFVMSKHKHGGDTESVAVFHLSWYITRYWWKFRQGITWARSRLGRWTSREPSKHKQSKKFYLQQMGNTRLTNTQGCEMLQGWRGNGSTNCAHPG
jgi:hypothetical protein